MNKCRHTETDRQTRATEGQPTDNGYTEKST